MIQATSSPEARVGERVRRPGDRHGAGELRVAERGQRRRRCRRTTNDSAISGTGLLPGRLAGQHEDAGADDHADAEDGQLERRRAPCGADARTPRCRRSTARRSSCAARSCGRASRSRRFTTTSRVNSASTEPHKGPITRMMLRVSEIGVDRCSPASRAPGLSLLMIGGLSSRSVSVPTPGMSRSRRLRRLSCCSSRFRGEVGARALAYARSELGDEHRRLERIVTHAPIGIVLVDADGRFVPVNPAFCEMLGYLAPSSPGAACRLHRLRRFGGGARAVPGQIPR